MAGKVLEKGELLSEEKKKILAQVALTIRGLSIDAVEKANSGHPGLPLGCAEIGAYLWGHALHHNPKHWEWVARDRFVLSAGHGCMLLYSCLHLSGFDLSMEELQHFRQLHSKTPGHPEFGDTEGVEFTTGPLGQGVGFGCGLGLGFKLLAEKYNAPEFPLFQNKVFILAGDGCIMEGVSSEASSFAGHLGLDNVILIYDSNKVCLDGPLPECCSENTLERYRGYGWETYEIDGHDFEAIHQVMHHLRHHQEAPALVVAHTIIGKGSPHKSGTSKVHGSPLGEEEARLTKEALGLPEEPFYVPQSVRNFFAEKGEQDSQREAKWKELFEQWSRAHPEKRAEFDLMHQRQIPESLEEELKRIEVPTPISGRKASQALLNCLADELPQLIGGSADLSGSDMTMIKKYPLIKPHDFAGRNIKFGVREFSMATLAAGLARTDFYLPFVGTFLTFSDYMRNAIRLISLMKLQVIFHFTHDSIMLGEDGPTHQPIEHYAALRAIPNLHFIRPADRNEVRGAWIAALRYQGPTAFALSRQNLPDVPGTDRPYAQGVGRGAYLLKEEAEGSTPDFTLIATGSELHLAYDVACELEQLGKIVRIISMPSWELFEAQPNAYKEKIFGGELGKRVVIEAGVDQGWHRYIGPNGIAITMHSFGASAPASALAKEFGYDVDHILEEIL